MADKTKDKKNDGFTYKDFDYSDDTKAYKEKADSYGNTPIMSQATNDAWNLANSYGNYNPNNYENVTSAKSAMDTHYNNKPTQWDGLGTWGQKRNDAIDAYTNRDKFSYNVNADALYQQYKDTYMNQGNQAMMDTMGQASALTGGYGNSYAQTVGQQTYQGYLQQLNDKIPELYQIALDQYNKEGENLLNQANLYGSLYNTEYGENRDRIADWQTEGNRLTNAYQYENTNAMNQHNTDRAYATNNAQYLQDNDTNNWWKGSQLANENYWSSVNNDNDQYNTGWNHEYTQYSDNRDYDYKVGRDAVSDAQWQAELDEKIRSNMADEDYKNKSLEEDKRQFNETNKLNWSKYYSSNSDKGSSTGDGTDNTELTEEEQIAQEKEYFSEFSANDWKEYFSSLLADRDADGNKIGGGSEAAKQEYERLRKAGILPNNYGLSMELEKIINSAYSGY